MLKLQGNKLMHLSKGQN